MIRTTIFAVALVVSLTSFAQAEFIIDSFHTVDTANDSNASLVHAAGGGDIFAEINTFGTIDLLSIDDFGYLAETTTIGSGFRLTYTWNPNGTYAGGNTFDALQSISGLNLGSIPDAFIGNWNLAIDGGATGSLYNGPAIGAPGGSTVALDDTTQLEFTFTYNGGGIGGTGFGVFGGGAPLFATPEPTGLMLLGSVGMLALARRRRR